MGSRITVLVDAENVRRSIWPNLRKRELTERCAEWADRQGHDVLVVFDGDAPSEAACPVVSTGAESADDWLAREARDHAPYWLVTSDRELRGRAGEGALRVVGGGAFVRELLDA